LKPLKLVKKLLRLWIATTATGSFLAGWALFAHAPKPVQSAPGATSVAAPMPTLAPLPPLDISGSSAGAGIQPPLFNMQGRPSLFAQAPLFRTGGS
jgi:hypothetical protein